jgi:hypothetical protein
LIGVFVNFVFMVVAGSFSWYFLSYLIDIFLNFNLALFPQYAGAHTTFMWSFSDWGLLILCLIPAAYYLWINTQRPNRGVF